MTEKYFYGIFKEEDGAVTVSIPDVQICETFGASWEEAYENAVDALAACLSVPETTVMPRSSKKELEARHTDGQIIPVPVDEKIIRSYEKKVRINIILPESLLREVDQYRAAAKPKINRSRFLAMAAEAYISGETCNGTID